MPTRGHIAVAEEVGPNIFDVKCHGPGLRGCPFNFQGFTWQGHAAAKEMIDRHLSAVEKVESDPNWAQSLDAPVIRRELYGYTGPKQASNA